MDDRKKEALGTVQYSTVQYDNGEVPSLLAEDEIQR